MSMALYIMVISFRDKYNLIMANTVVASMLTTRTLFRNGMEPSASVAGIEPYILGLLDL